MKRAAQGRPSRLWRDDISSGAHGDLGSGARTARSLATAVTPRTRFTATSAQQDVRCPFELRFHVPLDVAVSSHGVTSRALHSLTVAILSRGLESENTRNYIAASAREGEAARRRMRGHRASARWGYAEPFGERRCGRSQPARPAGP